MTIVEILLKASLLMGLAALAQALLARRTSAATRHLLWTLAVVALLMLPVLSTVLPGWTAIDLATPPAAPAGQHVESPVARLATEVTSYVSASAGKADTPSATDRLNWPTVAAAIYGIAVLLLLVRLLIQRWSVHRLTRRATDVTDPGWTRLLDENAARLDLRTSVRLLRSLDETIPMAVGTWRPAILIPAIADTWSEDRRRSVLLHELAHVARYDCLIQTLAAVACALYWIHPGVWWIARRLRAERELACDDRVLSAGADAHDYAGHLLELAYVLRTDVAPALAVTMAAPRQLEGRLRALLDGGRRRQVPALGSRLAALATMTCLVAAIAAARATATPLAAFAPDDETAPLLAIQDPPRQTFEVASVKPNKSTETGGFIQRRPGGNFAVGNQTLRTLITLAYQIQGFQLVDAPDWINSERFDIVAKAAGDIPPTPFGGIAPETLMLRSLLEDRFKLAVHRETRELPIYALAVARSDGRLGPRIRRPTSDFCAQRFKASATAVPPPSLPTDPVCGIRGSGNEFTAGSFPLSEFTRILSGQVRRVVIDRTGLTGEWDFDLKWSPPDAAAADPDRPSIFTALQEQLGLRLEATTGPVEVLVVDAVERPTPD